MSDIKRNYYEVLGCSKEASPEELKKSYQSLILKYHPDKRTPDNKADTEDSFHSIDTAYKILRDPESRKIYDAELLQKEFSERPFVLETVHRREFTRDEECGYFMTRKCRCGSGYTLPEKEYLRNESFYITCSECSLVILVIREIMDFGDNFEQQEIDPAAEFLAREQSALAGLEDDLNPPAAVPQVKTEDNGTLESSESFEMINNIESHEQTNVNGKIIILIQFLSPP
uniref:J domain-containing protein n=1 Tax=Phlebotomus papatasi TaxID=29031 RepID=A0A1B0D006_PHLPP